MYAADFEVACVKIQEGRAHQLSRAQKVAVSQLAVREAPATGAASDGAQAAAKRRKTMGSSGDEKESFVERLKSARKAVRRKTSYPLVAAIPPTSNIVERLFSVARLTLGLERHNLPPITFEAAARCCQHVELNTLSIHCNNSVCYAFIFFLQFFI
ncbi:hypothetical protein PI125_g18293 [Phytophthora idaei]|nr:hypothetical protein PI125_g18293 [Phytophthora idaei]KAG3135311.1 hypothetical protein PI126_g18312 [Phytophthora idaei]